MKKSLTTILAIMVLGSSVIGFAAPKKTVGSKRGTKIEKTTKKTNNSRNNKINKENGNNKKLEEYTCGNDTIKVEYKGEQAKVIDKNGVHNLKISKSASGELYTNSNGVSLHTNGRDVIYTSAKNSPDFVCEKKAIETVNKNKVENFKHEGKNLKVEYISMDEVKVTDFQGHTHNLKRVESASGEKFSSNHGVELQYKGNSGIFTISGVDYSITK